MPIDRRAPQRGLSLIELVVFMVVVAIALSAMVMAMNTSLIKSADPLVQIRALECAQAKLDEIVARKFDEHSPTGGIPACGSAEVGAVACAGIVPNPSMNDLGDFDGQVDNTVPGCAVSVSVTEAGADLGLPNHQARLITVDVLAPGGNRVVLSTYRSNF